MNSPTFDLGPSYGAHLVLMRARLETALAAAELEGLVIFSGVARPPPRDDVTLPFRAEPHFLSWLPLPRLEGAALVLRPGAPLELVFPESEDFWHAPAVAPTGDWTGHFSMRFASSAAAAASIVRELVGADPRRFAVIGDPGEAFAAGGGAALGTADARQTLAALDYARAIKTPFEIDRIAEANTIAARGHRAVARRFAGGAATFGEAARGGVRNGGGGDTNGRGGHGAVVSAGSGAAEFDLHQTYMTATRLREQEFPYQNIVALNEHAAVLHYQHLDTAPPARTRSLLIDAGAQASGYAADVTRTWARDADEFHGLIDAMDALQQAICREVAPGIDFVELNDRTHARLARVLSEHGLVSCGADEAYASGVTRVFLPHGLGHFLGLQVHDVAGRQTTPEGDSRPPPDEHPFLRLTRRLETGMALTIEPGLYFIPALLASASAEHRRLLAQPTIERLAPCGGIRIEDNLVVTKDGSRNVTREAFAAVTRRVEH